MSLRLRFEVTVMRSQSKGQKDRDLVEELIGEEADNDFTHKPDGSHEILNDIVVDRGPNPSVYSNVFCFFHVLTYPSNVRHRNLW